MNALLSVFPANDFFLLVVILGLPLIGALVNGVFGKRLGPEAVSLMALTSVGGSFVSSVAAFFVLRQMQAGGEEVARLSWIGWRWMDVSAQNDLAQFPIQVAFSLDSLSGTMALVVTGVGFLIHLYSTKYMEGDEGYHRFFCYLNLFIFAMLVLILGDNLPVLFVGWEGVGLCSYLLIGFWFKEEVNAQAGKKAFITNRVGDFGLLVAMALLVWHVGALDWQGIEAGKDALLTPVKIYPVGQGVPAWLPETVRGWLTPDDPAGIRVSAATLVGLALFLGCAGKSAQIPLYVWLPDAMAGPTPVSALIHAATMVTAGVYLCCRMAAVLVLSPAVMFTIAIIGLATALLAASIALVQNDIKKVLAYSTVSQLGYMFLGVGVGAFSAGFFHVVTHAFFKGCLFLGAGSVIQALHVRIHDHDASQDIRNMGGLKPYLPITYWTFLFSCLAISGTPLTSGFFSKDEILHKAYTSALLPPRPDGKLGDFQMWLWPEGAGKVLFWLGMLGAVMTAFYMFRLFFRTFHGEFRGWAIVRHWKPAASAHDGHDEHAEDEAALEGPRPKESPLQMTVPLMILGGLALVAGFFNPGALHELGLPAFHPLDDFLEPVFEHAAGAVATLHGSPALLAVGVAAFAAGLGVAYWMYMMRQGRPAEELAERLPRLHEWALQKWKVDELYEETFIGAVDTLGEVAVWFDKWVVDGIIARVTAFLVAAAGTILRWTQTGRVQAYGAVMVLGMAGLGWFFVSSHPAVTVDADDEAGRYTVTASSGLGYRYRWDVDGDGEFDTEGFDGSRSVRLELGVDEKRTIALQVKNVFGSVRSKSIPIARERKDRSAPRTTATAPAPTATATPRPRPTAAAPLQIRKAIGKAVNR